jgi:hypothetical protein
MLEHIHDVPVFMCDPEGPQLRDEADALQLLVDAGREAEWVVVPASRVGDDFFELRTRVAGDIVQKFVNYRMGFAVLGDISAHTANSESLAAFVRESNRGRHIWFVSDVAELTAQLARAAR